MNRFVITPAQNGCKELAITFSQEDFARLKLAIHDANTDSIGGESTPNGRKALHYFALLFRPVFLHDLNEGLRQEHEQLTTQRQP